MKTNRDKQLNEMRSKIKQSLFTKKETISKNIDNSRIVKRSTSNTQLNIQPQSKPDQKQNSCIQNRFHDLYQIGTIIGQGSNGIVKVCYKKTQSNQLFNFGHIPTKYAVKIIPNADDPELINTITQTFIINRELNTLPQIIQVFDLFIDENEKVSYLVMEYCEWKSLQYYLDKNQLTIKQIREIIRNLAISLKSIHNKGICHRDIKPDNILVKLSDQTEIKIIDFGVSKQFFKKNKNGIIFHEMWTRTGTILFQAPEIFLCGIYNEKIDIWSCGIILYQLLCHKFPFLSDTIIDTIETITDTNYNPWRSQEFLDLHYLQQDLLKRILIKDPKNRLSAEELLLHPWISMKTSQYDKTMDDTQISKKKSKFRDFKIATCLQLSDMINPYKNSSPLYLNPIQNGNIINDQNNMNHVYFNHNNNINKNKIDYGNIKISDFIVRSKQMMSGKSSFLFAIESSQDNSPKMNIEQSELYLDDKQSDEVLQYRQESRFLDWDCQHRKFSK
ncbi:unnamed protein product [Paramecium primaurelia]|uniref:Protein kinase domain-containing protein n=1 Tax=Paramecium primaurelia TaxID=5886 RepID=A0A8S1NJ12_PARPR|nr:unnamed protein product [Paramecium primaurelia]